MNTPGDRLYQLRLRLGLTQEQLANKAGLTQSYIGRIERGERQPTVQVWARLARLVGVSVTALIWPGEDAASQPDEPVSSDDAPDGGTDGAQGMADAGRRVVELEDHTWLLTYRGQVFDHNLLIKLIKLLRLVLDGDAIPPKDNLSPGAVAWQSHTNQLVASEEALKESLRRQAQAQAVRAEEERKSWQKEADQREGPQRDDAQCRAEEAEANEAAWKAQAEGIERLKTIETQIHLARALSPDGIASNSAAADGAASAEHRSNGH